MEALFNSLKGELTTAKEEIQVITETKNQYLDQERKSRESLAADFKGAVSLLGTKETLLCQARNDIKEVKTRMNSIFNETKIKC